MKLYNQTCANLSCSYKSTWNINSLAKMSLAVALVGSTYSASAQVSLTGTPNPYTQNFDTYRGSAATLPTGFSVGTGTYRGINTGTGTAGGYYGYAATGNTTDYSFGVLRSGSAGEFSLNGDFTNNTGDSIGSLTIALDYEQYRFANTSGFSVTGTGALAGFDLSGLNFSGSPTGTTGTPAITPDSLTLTDLNIANGATFGIAFTTFDAAAADNGLAIDNFSLSFSPVPEPGAMFAGLGLVGLAGFRERRKAAASRRASRLAVA